MIRISKKKKLLRDRIREISYPAKFTTAKIPGASFPTAKMFMANVLDMHNISQNANIFKRDNEM